MGMGYLLLPKGMDVKRIDAFAGCSGLAFVCHSREEKAYIEQALGFGALVR